MEISNYVIYELLIRLQELHPGVGEYISNKKNSYGVMLTTTTGSIQLPQDLLHQQFQHPSLISPLDILSLLENFKLKP